MAKSPALVSTSDLVTISAHLLPEEKLAILQAADSHRKWYSLDDQRVCVLCDKVITGRQIGITSDSRGGYALHCPTEGCPSVPSDWFYHGAAMKRAGQRTVEVDLW